MNVVRRVKPTQDWAHEAKERVATYQPGGALVGYIVVGRSTEGDMSHGVHAVQHEVEHQIEHEEHGHGAGRRKSLAESANKRIALLISVLALFLAFSETLGKKSQTAREKSLVANILKSKENLANNFNWIFRNDVCEFESSQPSQAVSSTIDRFAGWPAKV
jgi:hypothetical protein